MVLEVEVEEELIDIATGIDTEVVEGIDIVIVTDITIDTMAAVAVLAVAVMTSDLAEGPKDILAKLMMKSLL